MIDRSIELEQLGKILSSIERTDASQDGLVCPKCNALKVVKSRSKGLDGLFMRFIPRRPYRCLHCYHRFWAAEKFTEDKRRIWSWSVVIIASALLLFLFMS